MYREVQQARRDIDQLQDHLRSAILADDTRDIATHMGAVRSLAVHIERALDEALDGGSSSTDEQSSGGRIIHDVVEGARHAMTEIIDPGVEVEERPLHAARREISDVITSAQYIELATCAAEMRPALLDCKTSSDHAAAYLQEALGSDEG